MGIVRFFLAGARFWSGFFLILGVLSLLLLIRPGLTRDYRLESFVAGDDEAYRTYLAFLEEFTSNEIAVIAIRTDDALSKQSLAATAEIVEAVKQLEAVEQVSALTELPAVMRSTMGNDLLNHPLVQGQLVGRDGRTSAVVMLMTGESGGGDLRIRTVDQLKETVDRFRHRHPNTEIVLAGPYVTLIDMYRYVDRDLQVFSAAAFCMLVIMLIAVFRRASPAVFAMGVSLVAVVICCGLIVLLRIEVSLTLQMLVILIVVLSVANCVHLAVALEREGSAENTLKRMLVPCTAVVLTTAGAFGSVIISNIAPIRTFGLLMFIGLIVAMILSYVALPLLGRNYRSDTVRADSIAPRLERIGLWSVRHRWVIIMVFLITSSAGGVGISRLRFESDFVKSFRPDSTVRNSYRFIEEHLSPVGTIDVVIRRKDGRSILQPKIIDLQAALAARIVEVHDPIRKAITIADVLSIAGPKPKSAYALQFKMLAVRSLAGNDLIRNFINADETAIRVNLRAVEGVDVGEKLAMCDDIRQQFSDEFGSDYEVTVTGLYHFYAVLVGQLVRDQVRSGLITVAIVMICFLVTLRSARLALVALAANLSPILFCLGLMGALKLPIHMTSVMMLSVTLGIAVDDTLHYLWQFRREWTATSSYHESIRRTHGVVGKACVFTTTVIAGGFWILTISKFVPTAYFGGLLAFSMLGALACDLLLLPALIAVIRPMSTPRSPVAPTEP